MHSINNLNMPDITITATRSCLCTVSKNIPDIFDCNLKKNYHILVIFDVNIPDTAAIK